MINQRMIFRKCPDVVLRHVAGEALLIPICRKLANMDRIFTLNTTGETVWNLLDGRRSVEEVARAVVERYDVSESVALSDVAELLAQFYEAGLVEPVA